MPELPDITLYVEALEERILGAAITAVTLNSPFLLRTVEPPVDSLIGRKVTTIGRSGKRITIGLSNDHWIVLHLMIAGRLHWTSLAHKPSKRKSIARFEFDTGTLLFTEAGSKRRASLHLFACTQSMTSIDRGGIEVFDCSMDEFAERLTLRNHTLKRALTDQALFSGIGNAYSDEILHHAKLSPIALTQKLSPLQIEVLFKSTTHTLQHWMQVLNKDRAGSFPAKVTAFRKGMSVHGRYNQPCPVCATLVQRIRYASNETNYCPRCQTDGKLLADRAFSRLLKKDWPKTIEALENASQTSTDR